MYSTDCIVQTVKRGGHWGALKTATPQKNIVELRITARKVDGTPSPSAIIREFLVFRGKLSSNSSSSLEISAVGENEKPIRKDEREEERFGSNLPFGIEQVTFAT